MLADAKGYRDLTEGSRGLFEDCEGNDDESNSDDGNKPKESSTPLWKYVTRPEERKRGQPLNLHGPIVTQLTQVHIPMCMICKLPFIFHWNSSSQQILQYSEIFIQFISLDLRFIITSLMLKFMKIVEIQK
jgi:hypothetical protein